MHLSIIANPVAGGGRPYNKIRNHIRQWKQPDWEVEFLTTKAANHAGSLAMELLKQPPDLLAVCGGDGTVNEIASRLPEPPFPIAILPGGTANVLARELQLPLDPVRALHIALKGKVRRVDLGKIATGNDRRFVFVAGIGFDAYAVYRARPALKAKIGMAAYAVAILECLRDYKFPEFQATLDGQTFNATSCLVCNSRKYGGGLVFCPDADMTDGFLDVLVMEGANKLALARFLISAWLGIPEKHDWVHRIKAKEVRFEGPAAVRIEADGELAGQLPVRISVSEKVFPLVVA